eukprot:g40835.t1
MGDLLEVYKIVKGIDKVNSQVLFPRVGEFITRGHSETAEPETLPPELSFEGEKQYALQQLRVKWQNLQKEISSKQKLFKAALEQNQEQKVYGLSGAVSTGMVLFKEEAQTLDKSVQTAKSLLNGLAQAFGEVSPQALAKDIEEVIEEVNEKKDAFFHILPEPPNQDVIEETLSCLQERLCALELMVKQQCEKIKDQLQQLMEYQ